MTGEKASHLDHKRDRSSSPVKKQQAGKKDQGKDANGFSSKKNSNLTNTSSRVVEVRDKEGKGSNSGYNSSISSSSSERSTTKFSIPVTSKHSNTTQSSNKMKEKSTKKSTSSASSTSSSSSSSSSERNNSSLEKANVTSASNKSNNNKEKSKEKKESSSSSPSKQSHKKAGENLSNLLSGSKSCSKTSSATVNEKSSQLKTGKGEEVNVISVVPKKTKITKKEKLAMMNLNVALASKSHQQQHHQSRIKTLSQQAKNLAVAALNKSKKGFGSKKSSASKVASSIPSPPSSSLSSSSPSSGVNSSPLSNNDSVDETINNVVKSVSSCTDGGKVWKAMKPKATMENSDKCVKGPKSKLSNNNPTTLFKAKDNDSIDETIESVLSTINSDSDDYGIIKLGENSSVTINTNTSVKSETVTKKANSVTDKSISATTTNTASSIVGNDEGASTSGGALNRCKKISFLYEEDIVDGFAIHSFLSYSDMKVSCQPIQPFPQLLAVNENYYIN